MGKYFQNQGRKEVLGKTCLKAAMFYLFFLVYMTLQIVVKHNQSKIAHANSWFFGVHGLLTFFFLNLFLDCTSVSYTLPPLTFPSHFPAYTTLLKWIKALSRLI